MSTCRVTTCLNSPRSYGLCGGHRKRVKDWGDVREDIPLKAHLTPWDRIRFFGWRVTTAGCWEYEGARNSDGYGCFQVQKKFYLAHRASYETWVGPIPTGLLVRHKCDNPPCINPDHLELGTQADNVGDRETRNRAYHPSGDKHWSRRMSLEKARQIRSKYAEGGRSLVSLGEEYGCSAQSISLIVRNLTWKETS